MRGQMMFPHRNHSMCGCLCEHSGMRGFITKEERKESLSEYIQELKREAQAAEETLSELGK